MRSVRQASGALDELAKLMPDTAERITESGDTEEVPVSELGENDVVLVRPGTSVPADGEVVEGESSVDESMITGESRPVDKAPGVEVVAGTVNQDGSLRIKITKTGEETTLAGIMRLVDEAQKSKSRTQLLADRAAGWVVLRGTRRRGDYGRRVGRRHGVQHRCSRTRSHSFSSSRARTRSDSQFRSWSRSTPRRLPRTGCSSATGLPWRKPGTSIR